jgi:Type II CAAX prenyl endopeptidase Rce1-like
MADLSRAIWHSRPDLLWFVSLGRSTTLATRRFLVAYLSVLARCAARLHVAGPFVLLRLEHDSPGWKGWIERLRLTRPQSSAWFWAAALSGFMYGGNWQDAITVAAAWIALWMEHSKEKWLYAAVPAFIFLKRNLSFIVPAAHSFRFFDSGFNQEFFRHFGPKDFMGVSLTGAWWVVVYYAAWLVVLNIFGEELWWRGYVLPRQELFFGRATWAIHGVFWSLFHLFIQPTLWDTTRMAVTGLALAFVAQRTRNMWRGCPASAGNGGSVPPLR